MAGFNPGDILIDNVSIISPRTGSWNMAANFLSCDIYESIFTPAVLVNIEVLDDKDYLSNLKLAGDEQLVFSFRKPRGQRVNYTLHLNSVKNIDAQGALKSKTYTLECVSREAMHGQTNHVQKAYNQPIHNIVEDIFKNFLQSKLPIFAEPTKGKRKMVIANQPAYHIIDHLRHEAVSGKNKGSNYMFWKTWKGFYFQSMEYMLQQKDVKVFKHENTMGHSLTKNMDTNIIAYRVIQNMDAMNRIHAGVTNQRVSTYDPHTHKYVSQDFKPNVDELIKLGIGGITTLATFMSLFSKGTQHHFRVVNPNQKVKVGKSFVPGSIPYKQLNLAQMQEQTMHMTVIGDPSLEPGKTFFANIPRTSGMTGNIGNDPQSSGRWLIAKTHHQVRRADARPRWVTNLECLKGSYQEKV